MNIKEKLFEVQKGLHVIDKTGYNAFSKYEYVQLGSIMHKLNPLLEKYNLVIVQDETHSDVEYIPMDKGYYSKAKVTISTVLIDSESEEKLVNSCSGFAMDKSGDKALFKAITGARKYGLAMMFKSHWDSIEPEQDTPHIPATRKQQTQPSNTADFF